MDFLDKFWQNREHVLEESALTEPEKASLRHMDLVGLDLAAGSFNRKRMKRALCPCQGERRKTVWGKIHLAWHRFSD